MSITHLDEEGRARMVDVGAKPVTAREATAEALVHLGPEAARAVREGTVKKGDVLAVAQVAGVMGAKSTPSIIPLCHPLPLSGVAMAFAWEGDVLRIRATIRTTAQTGVEMEALTAVSVAALAIYDMCKAVDKEMTIDRVRLVHKIGGKSGEFTRAGESSGG
jgi:cyclic pyranopterin phosphate synthase